MSERLRVDYNASRRTTSHRRVRACPYRKDKVVVYSTSLRKERGGPPFLLCFLKIYYKASCYLLV